MFITDFLWDLIINAVVIISGGTILITFVCANYYKKATSARAFVRTGAGGNVVVCDGGALVLPLYQGITWINMSLQKLDLNLKNSSSLNTKDHSRVDVKVTFFMKVQPEISAVLKASRALGESLDNRQNMINIMQPRLKSILRECFLEFDLHEINDKNRELKSMVLERSIEMLTECGLVLESFCLSECEQTAAENLDCNTPQNMQYMLNSAEQIEAMRIQKEGIAGNAA